MAPQYYIGTSGWHYEHWRGRFYPQKLPKTRWLEFYAASFNSVELNNSFYRLPSEAAWTGWHRQTPDGFTFAVKASRFITHIKRLRDTAGASAKFIARAGILGEKQGPLLYQLPPGMHRNDAVLESFLSALPPDLKHAVEFRHPSWLDEGVFDILRRYHTALCVFDMPSLHCPLAVTADFAYIRFHGASTLYSSSYTDQELAVWAGRLTNLAARTQAVYIYFNNDTEAFAVNNALTLRRYLSNGKPSKG
ncbi:MAG: DUF72 domain-containing protein [Chloroflexota bacterium]